MWIASCTKLVTTIAAMQCVEKGVLSLDMDISSLLDEWKSPQILRDFDHSTGEPLLVHSTRNITLRHLLSHTSGLCFPYLAPSLIKWRAWRHEEPDAYQVDLVWCQLFLDHAQIESQSNLVSRSSTTQYLSYTNPEKGGSTALPLTGPARWWSESTEAYH